MPRLVSEIQEDFSRGMADSWAANRYPANASRLITNGRVEADGTISRRDGNRRKNAVALNAGGVGWGAQFFRTGGGDLQEIAIFGDKAYVTDDDWETSTEIATGLREDYYDFVSMIYGGTKRLLLANGDSTIKTWDGSSWGTLAGAPNGVKHLAVHNQRLAVSGHDGIIVQLSKVITPTVWTAAGGALTVQILNHQADELTGIHGLGPHLLVWDPKATSYIDGFGEQTLIVAQGSTGASQSVGCIAFRTIEPVGDDELCWLSARGIEYYRLGGQITLLTHGIQDFVRTIDFTAINNDRGRPTACYDADAGRQYYHCAVPTLGSARNSRTVAISLYQRGRDFRGAPSVDEQAYAAGTELLFGADADGYIEEQANGFSLRADANGYASLATAGSSGDPVVEDADGYIATDTNDTLPATLYLAPSVGGGLVVHSAGYDGFVRRHFGSDHDLDDELADLTGGEDVTLRLVPRPFVMKRPRQRKRVRVIHVGAINDEAATVQVRVRAGGVAGTLKSITIPASNFGQLKRGNAKVHGIDDAPQVEIITTDRTRIALAGISAELLREPV